jgi:L-iditol 2-dehydrogenase
MKKAVILGQRKAGLVDVPDPGPVDDLVLVKVHVTPMCTEYKAFIADKPSASLGHEAAGEVVAVDKASRVKVGERVVVMPSNPCGRCPLCLGGDYIHCQSMVDLKKKYGLGEGGATYAQYLLKTDWLLAPIPEGMSYEHASMACCGLGPTFAAMETMQVGPFDTVLITGAGPVGLGGVINARYRGARVIVVENKPFRVAKAKALGAACALDQSEPDVLRKVLDATGGTGVDKAVDCCGDPVAHRLCIDATRRRGQVAFIGETYAYGDTPMRISPDLIRKGLTLHGVWHYNLALIPRMFQMIRQSGPALDELISHVLPMSQVQKALELCASYQCSKIVLRPWE